MVKFELKRIHFTSDLGMTKTLQIIKGIMNFKTLILIMLYTCIQGCSKSTVDPICYLNKPRDTYKYPILPRSPEWALLNTSEEMDSVLQIPNQILKSISTEGLVETSLHYPRFSDLYFSDDYQRAFNIIESHFNGFQELLKRSDAASVLTERYELMDPSCIHNNYPSINGDGSSTSFSFAFIEILIAQYEILSLLENENLQTLLKECLLKYEVKKDNNSSLFTLKHSLLIAARIMYFDNYDQFIQEYNNNESIKFFTDRVMLLDSTTLDVIYDLAKRFPN